jgi:hypothetical protein
MFFLADGPKPGGPARKLCPSEEPNEAMVIKGPDGRMVPAALRKKPQRTDSPTNRGAMDLSSKSTLRAIRSNAFGRCSD